LCCNRSLNSDKYCGVMKFGRHALLSRGWGILVYQEGQITLSGVANNPVEVRILLLQLQIFFTRFYLVE
jgi:hypothetical protein